MFFFPTKESIQTKKVANNKKIKLLIKFTATAKGVITAPTPNIRSKFNTHEPTKFPMAKSVSLLIVATIEVTSSGEAVPIATIVEPIIASERPHNFRNINSRIYYKIASIFKKYNP